MRLFSATGAQPVSDLPADPRTRLALNALLQPRPASWVGSGQTCASLPCQHCWLYWLLRSRQPQLALARGRIEADWLIVAGSAIACRAGARLQCQPNADLHNGTDALQESIGRAGLEWGIRLIPPLSRHAVDSIQALILAEKLRCWPERLIELAPTLAPGAFVIGLVSGGTRAAIRRMISTLNSASVGFEAMVMDINGSTLVLADYRSN